MYVEFVVALLVPMLSEFSDWCTLHLFTKLDGLILVLVHTAQVMWLCVFYSARCRMPGGGLSNLTKMVMTAMFTSRCETDIW
jgi:hypothetical protein